MYHREGPSALLKSEHRVVPEDVQSITARVHHAGNASLSIEEVWLDERFQ
jgi:hypothetical protein